MYVFKEVSYYTEIFTNRPPVNISILPTYNFCVTKHNDKPTNGWCKLKVVRFLSEFRTAKFLHYQKVANQCMTSSKALWNSINENCATKKMSDINIDSYFVSIPHQVTAIHCIFTDTRVCILK